MQIKIVVSLGETFRVVILLYSAIVDTCEEKENGIILSVDQKSAFDIIEWKFMYRTLAFSKSPELFKNGSEEFIKLIL
jgi:hypothetical protein